MKAWPIMKEIGMSQLEWVNPLQSQFISGEINNKDIDIHGNVLHVQYKNGNNTFFKKQSQVLFQKYLTYNKSC